MKNNKYIITFENISFSYEKKQNVLDDVTFAVKSGETIGIVGGNGAGKSTLMKLITGLILPDEGRVTVTGIEVKNRNLKRIREKVGYTFQDPDNQLFMPSVFEDVAFAARQKGKTEEEVKRIVASALKKVDASHLAQKASFKMSGGEKRVVTLATVLASEPDILILDEPSVGLDPRSRRQLIRLLSTRDETKVITTHDMDMVLDLCDRIIVLYNGKVHADDNPMAIFENKDLLYQNHLELPLRLQSCPVCGR